MNMLLLVVFTLILSVSKVSSQKTNVTKMESYQVTENVIDIPDNRTLPPIVPNYGVMTPLNMANYSLNNGTINHGATQHASQKNDSTVLKRNSVSFLHIKVETEAYAPPKIEDGGIKKVFTGIRDYFHNVKKGVVDGLHNFFHRNDNSEGQLRNDGIDEFGDFDIERLNDDYDDDFKQEFEHY